MDSVSSDTAKTLPVRSIGPIGREVRFGPEEDPFYLGVLAGFVSLLAFFYFFRHGDILLYGDATAHIHIARRIFDSRTPGPMQLGTVWLPLPHLLIMPFLLSHWAWQSGVGGSIPSMVAYVAGAIGVFRLTRGALPQTGAGRMASWSAALIYIANPNLLYLQSTAMTEPLYLALFVWATAYFSEFVQATKITGAAAHQQRTRSLYRCGIMLLAAMLTRYDGWLAAAMFTLAAFVVFWTWTGGRVALWRSPLRPAFIRFVVLVALAPVLWFAYNTIGWGNPLEFATGPYSAHAIEARAERPGGWHYPGWHSPKVAGLFFLKSAKLNMAGATPERELPDAHRRPWRLENVWLPLALLGTGLLLIRARSWWPWLFLWLPLPFYSTSIAWGGVPVFLPEWWPYSYYNVRYGLQLLPAFAVFAALAAYFLARLRKGRVWPVAVYAVLVACVAGSYAVAWRSTPICLREAQTNSRGRLLFDQKLADHLDHLPPDSTVLMYTATHAAALEFAGFPLRRTINETNKKPWRDALAAPAHFADFVVAFDTPEDPVWQAAQQHADELQLLVVLSSPGHPRAFLYRRR